MSQIAINWLIRKDSVTSVIAGAQKVEHLEENLGAIDWDMDDNLYKRIEKIITESNLEL
jgi:aryl-alcohol dehydrogenase-like predicted oxidoreductase